MISGKVWIPTGYLAVALCMAVRLSHGKFNHFLWCWQIQSYRLISNFKEISDLLKIIHSDFCNSYINWLNLQVWTAMTNAVAAHNEGNN